MKTKNELTLREKAVAAQCNFALRQEVIMHYLPVAKKIANKYATDLFPADDLEQVATIAIIDSIDGYGYEKSSHISTFIFNETERAILQYIKKESTVYYDHIVGLENAVEMQSKYNTELAENDVLKDVLKSVINNNTGSWYVDLTDRERFVIKTYFFNGKTMEDIGKYLGVSTERVKQIILKSLRKLRHPSRSKYLKDWY